MAELLTTRAVAREVQQAPRKVGLVASLIRGRTVADALVILEHTPRRAAKPIEKIIKSAQANAVSTHGMAEDGMILETIMVSAGPRMKRYRPAAHGRALPYQKKTSHITVVVSGALKSKKTPVAKTAKKEDK